MTYAFVSLVVTEAQNFFYGSWDNLFGGDNLQLLCVHRIKHVYKLNVFEVSVPVRITNKIIQTIRQSI